MELPERSHEQMPSPNPEPTAAPGWLADVLRQETCAALRVLPLAWRRDRTLLELGMAEPQDRRAVELVQQLVGVPVIPIAVDWAAASRLLEHSGTESPVRLAFDAGAAETPGPAGDQTAHAAPRDPLLDAPDSRVQLADPFSAADTEDRLLDAPDEPPAADDRELALVPDRFFDEPSPRDDPVAEDNVAPVVDLAQRRLGDILVHDGAITPTELRHALFLQRRAGGRLGKLLTHHGIASPDAVAAAIAQQLGLVKLDVIPPPTTQAAALVPESVCRRHSLLPLDIDNHRLRVAMADPEDASALEALRRFTRLAPAPVVASEQAIVEGLRELHRDAQTQLSVYGLLNRNADESAHVVLCPWQKAVLVFALVGTFGALAWNATLTVTVFGMLGMCFYTAFSVFKVRAVLASLGHEPMLSVTEEQARSIPEADLPVYTVLVPLYKETQVLPRLVKGLAELDYPTSKLDVKLLLEEDDSETVEAARAMDLPAFIDIVVTPDSQPKTKPKSCNYGLLYARGEYTVIFDAEDIPERDQLRKAVAAFRKAPENVVCLQGMLNYYNLEQNLLTKWFTGEYSGWFDMFVPGLDNLDLPIPLGGTSNHFVTDVLIELGAWDPFNVTEDADLGIRLFHAGYKTATLNSTTFEEANSETFNWIRQRSRWVKGYIQTWLVHMRHPVRLAHGVGLRNWIGFQLVIAGTFFVFLLNPFQWAILLLWTLTKANLVRELFPGAVYYFAWFSFLVGNFAFVYINVLAVMRRRYWNLVWAALLSPLYWALMSIAAWRGLLQLITAPSYWEKTEHGLDGGAHDAAISGGLPGGPAP